MPPACLERRLEVLAEQGRVLDALVGQQVGGLAEVLHGVLGASGRLDVVAERREEDLVADLRGDLGRRGADRDVRDAGILEGLRRREHGVGVGVADERLDLVLLDELLGGLGRHAHVVLAVVDDEVDRLAEDAARGVDLLDGEQRTIAGGHVEARFQARQGEPATDAPRLATVRGGALGQADAGRQGPEDHDPRDGQCADSSLHACSPADRWWIWVRILRRAPRRGNHRADQMS